MQRFFPPLCAVILIMFSCRDNSVSASRPGPTEPASSGTIEMTLHQKFDFTDKDISSRLKGIPVHAVQDAENFLELVSLMLEDESWTLNLVDKNHPLSEDFAPPEIVALTDYPELELGRSDLMLNRNAAEALAELSRSAESIGITLLVSSAYRSWEYQKNLFARYAARDGEEKASRYSARPGESQHQLGTTVDFGDITNAFAYSDAGVWLADNGPATGWSLSYPEGKEDLTGYMWESWHWRYLGRNAVLMQQEYFAGSQQDMLLFWHENSQELASSLMQ